MACRPTFPSARHGLSPHLPIRPAWLVTAPSYPPGMACRRNLLSAGHGLSPHLLSTRHGLCHSPIRPAWLVPLRRYPAFPDDSALIGSPEKFRVLNRAKEGVAIGRVKNAAPDNLVWHEISVAQGADASLIGLAASTVSLLRDRADFEAESAMGGERLAGGAGAG